MAKVRTFRRLDLSRLKEKPKYGAGMTAFLLFVLVLISVLLWSAFVSGPVRLHEEQQARVEAKIRKAVPGIEGLTEHVFDYVTWNGYTSDKLYWFDEQGKQITTRDIATLDYDAARQTALEQYGVETDTIQLTFGYNRPCYEIEGSGTVLLLDYDSRTRVYERPVDNAWI